MESNRRYYGYARQALADAFRIIGLNSGDTVLYPAYICDVTLAPCFSSGLKIVYYPIKSNFEPDWDVLDSLVHKDTKAVLSVNYFGFPTDFRRWRDLATRKKIWWLEDNAHGYGSLHEGQSLGSFGDISVACPRKVLPLLNGACLQINTRPLESKMLAYPPSTGSLFAWLGPEELWRLAGYVLRWTRAPLHRFHSHTYDQMAASNESDHRPPGIDLLSYKLLNLFDDKLPIFREARRRAYRAWQVFSVKQGLRPAFETLPDGVSPLAYPCYAKDIRERNRWLEWGKKNLIDVHTWPSLPESLRAPHGRSIQQWNRLLCFPVHQDISIARDLGPL